MVQDYYAKKDGINIYQVHGMNYIYLKNLQTHSGLFALAVQQLLIMKNIINGKIHYPLLLQRLLQKSVTNKNIEVINIAYNGYSTAQSLIEFF